MNLSSVRFETFKSTDAPTDTLSTRIIVCKRWYETSTEQLRGSKSTISPIWKQQTVEVVDYCRHFELLLCYYVLVYRDKTVLLISIAKKKTIVSLELFVKLIKKINVYI